MNNKMTNKTDKKTTIRLKKTKTQDNFFQMRDADGKSLTKGDTVSVLCNGVELVDMDTLDDVTGVITEFKDDCAVVNGSMLTSGEMRRVRMKA